MPRTVTDIYNSILAKQAEYSELNEMSSTSNTALYKLLAYIYAFISFSLESLFDQFKLDVDEKLKMPAHNARWYQKQALAYQHGDELAWLENQEAFGYLVADEEKQIVARAAAIETNGGVVIKVVKEVSGDLHPLTSVENAGLLAYLNKIKDAGVRISSRSWLPDDLYLEYDIQYNPLILASDGSLLSNPGIKPVENAIQEYIKQLDFNGRFSISKLEDAIQNVPGVIDFSRDVVQSRFGSNSFTNVIVSKVAESGYMKLHETSIIIYTPANV